MRASGYPQKAMWTNFIGAGLNMILAPIFLFGFGLGVKGAALATDISMLVTAVFVMWHFFDQKKELSFKPGTYKLDRRIVQSVLAIGLAPFLINMAGSLINAIINNTLYLHGGDNAIAAVVVFNRYVTIFVMTVIGICQGMQPIVGYNYGAGKYDRLFRTFWLAAAAGFVVTVIGSAIGRFAPRPIAQMFMQDEQQIVCAIDCLQITAMGFWMVGYQIVATNFFQALGMAGKSIFLSLSRQIIFMIPLLMVLPSMWQLDGVWAAYPISDVLATIVTSIMLFIQIRRIKAKGRNRLLSDQQL
jgi:Na+-driven multidrug efflux pump